MSTAKAAEVDDFHALKHEGQIVDSRAVIDAYTSRLWSEAIDEANRDDESCSEKALYKSLQKRFGNHVFSEAGKWLYATDELPQHKVSFEDAIYNGMSFGESLMLSDLMQTLRKWTPLEVQLASVVNYDGYYFGVDKFEHFWGTGSSYFDAAFSEGEVEYEKALRDGEFKERTVLGRLTTGVYSYGDLAANFDGMRFWNNVLGKHPDVLGRPSPLAPYVKCENAQWRTQSFPDWSFYMSPAWNEANNCSRYKKDSMRDKIFDRVAELEHMAGRSLQCPIDPSLKADLEARYTSRFIEDLPSRVLNFENKTFEELWREANPPRERLRQRKSRGSRMGRSR